ncbi:glycosyltransferase [Solwaraspora sp. WMMD406]|uniref:glycosyltransferase n=1 Tax=Solwaraspora sp. WMMD406 TaxID=3016095 RepID=UPI002417312B|nr:glycosyltransferase [Solwaraspora sp. WMMD406]MDG4767500.1 glycosyltransferase [Solwaraspora sp. WMMD406]
MQNVPVRIPRQRTPADRPTVLVAVGTDRHRFDRLIDWLEQWQAAAAGRAAVHVQYGHSRAPRFEEATAFLDHDALQRAMAGASLVVCHGGPATILEARRHRHLPIVVPRDPAHGEHVDDHQLLFARRLSDAGLIRLCQTQAELAAALDAGLREPTRFAVASDTGGRAARQEAVARVGGIVEELISARASRRILAWRSR